jgi:hypothetical protein
MENNTYIIPGGNADVEEPLTAFQTISSGIVWRDR